MYLVAAVRRAGITTKVIRGEKLFRVVGRDAYESLEERFIEYSFWGEDVFDNGSDTSFLASFVLGPTVFITIFLILEFFWSSSFEEIDQHKQYVLDCCKQYRRSANNRGISIEARVFKE
jgi:hypothetical protein